MPIKDDIVDNVASNNGLKKPVNNIDLGFKTDKPIKTEEPENKIDLGFNPNSGLGFKTSIKTEEPVKTEKPVNNTDFGFNTDLELGFKKPVITIKPEEIKPVFSFDEFVKSWSFQEDTIKKDSIYPLFDDKDLVDFLAKNTRTELFGLNSPFGNINIEEVNKDAYAKNIEKLYEATLKADQIYNQMVNSIETQALTRLQQGNPYKLQDDGKILQEKFFNDAKFFYDDAGIDTKNIKPNDLVFLHNKLRGLASKYYDTVKKVEDYQPISRSQVRAKNFMEDAYLKFFDIGESIGNSISDLFKRAEKGTLTDEQFKKLNDEGQKKQEEIYNKFIKETQSLVGQDTYKLNILNNVSFDLAKDISLRYQDQERNKVLLDIWKKNRISDEVVEFEKQIKEYDTVLENLYKLNIEYIDFVAKKGDGNITYNDFIKEKYPTSKEQKELEKKLGVIDGSGFGQGVDAPVKIFFDGLIRGESLFNAEDRLKKARVQAQMSFINDKIKSKETLFEGPLLQIMNFWSTQVSSRLQAVSSNAMVPLLNRTPLGKAGFSTVYNIMFDADVPSNALTDVIGKDTFNALTNFYNTFKGASPYIVGSFLEFLIPIPGSKGKIALDDFVKAYGGDEKVVQAMGEMAKMINETAKGTDNLGDILKATSSIQKVGIGPVASQKASILMNSLIRGQQISSAFGLHQEQGYTPADLYIDLFFGVLESALDTVAVLKKGSFLTYSDAQDLLGDSRGLLTQQYINLKFLMKNPVFVEQFLKNTIGEFDYNELMKLSLEEIDEVRKAFVNMADITLLQGDLVPRKDMLKLGENLKAANKNAEIVDATLNGTYTKTQGIADLLENQRKKAKERITTINNILEKGKTENIPVIKPKDDFEPISVDDGQLKIYNQGGVLVRTGDREIDDIIMDYWHLDQYLKAGTEEGQADIYTRLNPKYGFKGGNLKNEIASRLIGYKNIKTRKEAIKFLDDITEEFNKKYTRSPEQKAVKMDKVRGKKVMIGTKEYALNKVVEKLTEGRGGQFNVIKYTGNFVDDVVLSAYFYTKNAILQKGSNVTGNTYSKMALANSVIANFEHLKKYVDKGVFDPKGFKELFTKYDKELVKEYQASYYVLRDLLNNLLLGFRRETGVDFDKFDIDNILVDYIEHRISLGIGLDNVFTTKDGFYDFFGDLVAYNPTAFKNTPFSVLDIIDRYDEYQKVFFLLNDDRLKFFIQDHVTSFLKGVEPKNPQTLERYVYLSLKDKTLFGNDLGRSDVYALWNYYVSGRSIEKYGKDLIIESASNKLKPDELIQYAEQVNSVAIVKAFYDFVEQKGVLVEKAKKKAKKVKSKKQKVVNGDTVIFEGKELTVERLKFLAFQQADKEILDELMSNFYPEYNKTYSSRIIAQRRLSIQKRIKKYEDLLEKLPSDKRIQKELRKLYFDLEVIEEGYYYDRKPIGTFKNKKIEYEITSDVGLPVDELGEKQLREKLKKTVASMQESVPLPENNLTAKEKFAKTIANKFDVKIVYDQDGYNKKLNKLVKAGVVSSDYTVYGFYDKATNTIYINPNVDFEKTLLHEATHVWFNLAVKHNSGLLDQWIYIANQFLSGAGNDQFSFEVLQRLKDYPEFFDLTMKDDVVVSATIKDGVNQKMVYDELLAIATEIAYKIGKEKAPAKSLFESFVDFLKIAFETIRKVMFEGKPILGSLHSNIDNLTLKKFSDLLLKDVLDENIIFDKDYFVGHATTRIKADQIDGGEIIENDTLFFKELSPKGKKLGFTNKRDEYIFTINDNLRKQSNGDPKKFNDVLKQENQKLYNDILNGDYTIQGFSQSFIDNEIRIARRRGQEQDINLDNLDQQFQLVRDSHQKSLNQWVNYLKENNEYSEGFKNYILREITGKVKVGNKIRKRTNDTATGYIPLNANALAQYYYNGKDVFFKDYPVILNDVVTKNMNFTENIKKGDIDGKWVKFDRGTDHKKLSSFVCNTGWCTANETHSEKQLAGGDFYVFATKDENGNYTVPRIAIRMLDDQVEEVRGILEDQHLEPEMFSIAKEKYKKLPGWEKYEIKELHTERTNKIEDKLKAGIELDVEDLRHLYEIDYEIQGFGYGKDKRIKEFKEGRDIKKDYSKIYNMSEENVALSLEEAIEGDKIKDNIRMIIGNVDFGGIQIRSLGNLEVIIGYADFRGSKIKDLGNLKEIRGDIYFDKGSQIKSLGNLEKIGGSVDFEGTMIENLGNLKEIGGRIIFEGSQIKTLGKLEKIGGDAYFRGSMIEDLGNLKEIKGYADFRNSQIKSLGNLEKIGGSANFYGSIIEDLGNLKEIGGDADFIRTQIKTLGKLEKIGGHADFGGIKIEDLGNLKEIGGNADFTNSQIKSLGKLKEIGGSAYFEGSQIKSLGKLEKIGSSAYFQGSIIEDLGNLKEIGKNAYFEGSQIKSLGNLKKIGKNADFKNSKIKSLGNLEKIGGDAYFRGSIIEDLGNLKEIGGSADFEGLKIKSLGNLEKIGWHAVFKGSIIEDLGNLKEIGGDANFISSQIKSLGNLEKIGWHAVFKGSIIEDLGNLKEIGGDVDFGDNIKLKEQWEQRKNIMFRKKSNPNLLKLNRSKEYREIIASVKESEILDKAEELPSISQPVVLSNPENLVKDIKTAFEVQEQKISSLNKFVTNAEVMQGFVNPTTNRSVLFFASLPDIIPTFRPMVDRFNSIIGQYYSSKGDVGAKLVKMFDSIDFLLEGMYELAVGISGLSGDLEGIKIGKELIDLLDNITKILPEGDMYNIDFSSTLRQKAEKVLEYAAPASFAGNKKNIWQSIEDFVKKVNPDNFLPEKAYGMILGEIAKGKTWDDIVQNIQKVGGIAYDEEFFKRLKPVYDDIHRTYYVFSSIIGSIIEGLGYSTNNLKLRKEGKLIRDSVEETAVSFKGFINVIDLMKATDPKKRNDLVVALKTKDEGFLKSFFGNGFLIDRVDQVQTLLGEQTQSKWLKRGFAGIPFGNTIYKGIYFMDNLAKVFSTFMRLADVLAQQLSGYVVELSKTGYYSISNNSNQILFFSDKYNVLSRRSRLTLDDPNFQNEYKSFLGEILDGISGKGIYNNMSFSDRIVLLNRRLLDKTRFGRMVESMQFGLYNIPELISEDILRVNAISKGLGFLGFDSIEDWENVYKTKTTAGKINMLEQLNSVVNAFYRNGPQNLDFNPLLSYRAYRQNSGATKFMNIIKASLTRLGGWAFNSVNNTAGSILNAFKYEKAAYYNLIDRGMYKEADEYLKRMQDADFHLYSLLANIVFAISTANKIARTENGDYGIADFATILDVVHYTYARSAAPTASAFYRSVLGLGENIIGLAGDISGFYDLDPNRTSLGEELGIDNWETRLLEMSRMLIREGLENKRKHPFIFLSNIKEAFKSIVNGTDPLYTVDSMLKSILDSYKGSQKYIQGPENIDKFIPQSNRSFLNSIGISAKDFDKKIFALRQDKSLINAIDDIKRDGILSITMLEELTRGFGSWGLNSSTRIGNNFVEMVNSKEFFEATNGNINFLENKGLVDYAWNIMTRHGKDNKMNINDLSRVFDTASKNPKTQWFLTGIEWVMWKKIRDELGQGRVDELRNSLMSDIRKRGKFTDVVLAFVEAGTPGAGMMLMNYLVLEDYKEIEKQLKKQLVLKGNQSLPDEIKREVRANLLNMYYNKMRYFDIDGGHDVAKGYVFLKKGDLDGLLIGDLDNNGNLNGRVKVSSNGFRDKNLELALKTELIMRLKMEELIENKNLDMNSVKNAIVSVVTPNLGEISDRRKANYIARVGEIALGSLAGSGLSNAERNGIKLGIGLALSPILDIVENDKELKEKFEMDAPLNSEEKSVKNAADFALSLIYAGLNDVNKNIDAEQMTDQLKDIYNLKTDSRYGSFGGKVKINNSSINLGKSILRNNFSTLKKIDGVKTIDFEKDLNKFEKMVLFAKDILRSIGTFNDGKNKGPVPIRVRVAKGVRQKASRIRKLAKQILERNPNKRM